MRFSLEDKGPAIELAPEVLATFRRFRQYRCTDREAGGQLFAVFQGNDTIIVDAKPPNKKDKRTRYSFVPDRNRQQTEIREMYAKGFHYVGDWHTHPEPVPFPSELDLSSMQDSILKSSHGLQAFILIILGTSLGPDGIFMALVYRNGEYASLRCEDQ